MEQPGRPGKEPKLGSRRPRSWDTACMNPQFGVRILVLLPLEVPPNLPVAPQREDLRGREGRGPRSHGPTVPRSRAARPLPPVSIAAETSCSILEAPLRDVGGVGVAGLPEAQEARRVCKGHFLRPCPAWAPAPEDTGQPGVRKKPPPWRKTGLALSRSALYIAGFQEG